MDASFDPYRKWLGIRTTERPPNHYQLLGLQAFEDDPETISHAADQRIAYVRTLAANDYVDASQRVLNELAAAKVALLNREKKAIYDQRLKAQQASALPPAVISERDDPPLNAIKPTPAEDLSRTQRLAAPPARIQISPRISPARLRMFLALGATAAMLLAVGAVLLVGFLQGQANVQPPLPVVTAALANQHSVDGPRDSEATARREVEIPSLVGRVNPTSAGNEETLELSSPRTGERIAPSGFSPAVDDSPTALSQLETQTDRPKPLPPRNTPPSVSIAHVEPSAPVEGDVVVMEMQGSDAESKDLQFEYRIGDGPWQKADTNIVSIEDVKAGSLAVEVRCVDEFGDSSPVVTRRIAVVPFQLRAKPLEELHRYKGHDKTVTAISVDRVSRTFVSGGIDGTTRVWRVGQTSPFSTYADAMGRSQKNVFVFDVASSGSGLYAAAVGGDRIKLWKLKTKKVLRALKGSYVQVTFSPNDSTVLCIKSGEVDVLDVGTGNVVQKIMRSVDDSMGDDWCLCAAVSNDGKNALTGGEAVISFWDLTKTYQSTIYGRSSRSSAMVTEPIRHFKAIDGGYIRKICFMSDGHRAATLSDATFRPGRRYGKPRGRVRYWDIDKGEEIVVDNQLPEAVSIASCVDRNRLLIAGADGKLYIDDDVRGKCLPNVAIHEAGLACVAASADGQSAFTGCDDGTIRQWDISKLLEANAPPPVGQIKNNVAIPRPTPRESAVGSAPKRIANSIKMQMAWVPAGAFLMGSPPTEPERRNSELQHRVSISNPFYMGVYEVTQQEYETLMGRNPSRFSPQGEFSDRVRGLDTRRLPVDSVSWDDAQEFCLRLSARAAERKAGRAYRLPTEAEWEYACRAGSLTSFHFGERLNGREANCAGVFPYGTADKGPYLFRTTFVGSYPPNDFGLFDLHGNVFEWCSDWLADDYYSGAPQRDPKGPRMGTMRSLRGGGWGRGGAKLCRSACRFSGLPTDRQNADAGFRIVCGK